MNSMYGFLISRRLISARNLNIIPNINTDQFISNTFIDFLGMKVVFYWRYLRVKNNSCFR